MGVLWDQKTCLKIAATFFTKQAANVPPLKLSNEVLCILGGQKTVKLQGSNWKLRKTLLDPLPL